VHPPPLYIGESAAQLSTRGLGIEGRWGLVPVPLSLIAASLEASGPASPDDR
jgi:hypothetical protein